MGLFGKKKEEEVKGGCCCGGTQSSEAVNECCCGEKTSVDTEGSCACGGKGCHIKVLGAGCKSCHEQYENVKKAVENMNLDAEVLYITDMEKVM
ncbi:MAG: thioredoxin family protein, partial [Lachnospiraceae bacterium]